jgi:hypothetical protein
MANVGFLSLSEMALAELHRLWRSASAGSGRHGVVEAQVSRSLIKTTHFELGAKG